MRKIVTIVIVTISTYALWFTHAENTSTCNTCNTTPEIIQEYILFMEQMVSTLNKQYNENEISPWAPFVWPFLGKQMPVAHESLFNNTRQTIQERNEEHIWFMQNTYKILTNEPQNLKTQRIQNLKTIFRPSKQRDIQKIQAIDASLQKINTMIGRSGKWSKTPKTETYQEIRRIIQNHKRTLLTEESQINSSATYKHITKLLEKMQKNIKSTIISWKQTQKTNIQWSLLKLSQQATDNIQKSYECTLQNKCNKNNNRMKEIKNTREQGTKNTKNATYEFILWRKRLKTFFNLWTTQLSTKERNIITQREKEITRKIAWYRGDNTQPFAIITYRNNFKKPIESQKKEQTKTIQEPEHFNLTTKKPTQQKIHTTLEQHIAEFQKQTQEHYAIIHTHNTQHTTETITSSIQTMHKITQKLETIEEKLIETCELQCTNKWWICSSDL